MKTFIIFLACMMSLNILMAQSVIKTDLRKASEDAHSYCVNVDLANVNAIAMRVEGQNVRVFYNSEKLQFDKVFMNGMMPLDAYEFDIRTNRSGLDKRDVKQLNFDHDMGFLNVAIAAKDERENQSIVESGKYIHAQTICFIKKSEKILKNDIVLAKEGITDKYSKAFAMVEASPVNEEILLPMNLLDVEQARTVASLHDD